MTDIRSFTNGHGGSSSGRATQAPRTGDFLHALQDAARENPFSAALIGMGVLWMLMGGSNISISGGGGRKSIFRSAAQRAEQVDSTVRETVGRVASRVEQETKDAGETASRGVGAVREASATAAETASKTAEQAKEAVGVAYDTTTSAASRAAQNVSNATASGARSVQEIGAKWGSTLQRNISDAFERQLLLLGAVGLAIGAGTAASIPTTEAEKNVMGAASDSIRRTVTDKVTQAKEMTAAALQEAKAQGLTPKAAGQAFRTASEKVASVAQSTSLSPES